jgi:threonine dehydratase
LPRSVDQAKEEKIIRLGSKVIKSPFDGYDETLEWTLEQVQKNRFHLISAFDDERIMAANGGTLAVEIKEAIPDVGTVIFPVGGGGIAAGMSFYFKPSNPSIRLIGCQHIDSPALKLSLERGEAVTALPAIDTVAGGIEGGIGKQCFEIIKERIDAVSLVSEEEIIEAFKWMLEHHQYLIEPSAVVTIASCLYRSPKIQGKTVVLLSGRNVSFATITKLLCTSTQKNK